MIDNVRRENNKNARQFDSLLNLLDGDEEALKAILATFIKDVPENISGIRVDCKNKNWVAARKKAHQIKPFYGYAGDHDMVSLLDKWLLEFENAAPSYDYQDDLRQMELATETIISKLKLRFSL